MSRNLSIADIAQSVADHLRLLSGRGVSGFECSEKTLNLIQNKERGHATPPGGVSLSTPGGVSLAGCSVKAAQCTACSLHSGRAQSVFGEGDPKAQIMFVGIAPGIDEEKAGRPFQGEVGNLLNNILKAMGLTREQVYLSNLTKCKTADGQAPSAGQIQACSTFLQTQIAQVTPRVVCTFGEAPTKAVLQQDVVFSRVRGKWQPYLGMKLMPTYHLSELLATPQKKRALWQDMQAIMRVLDLPIP